MVSVDNTNSESVKVYTVNGAATGSSSSLPDWLTRKRALKGKGKRGAVKELVEGSIELIQHFEFPEASNRVKTTRDGHHAIATGVYKPQMKVYDLDQLSLKFERHSDAENVDFVILSDDWTKTIHLQNDRTVELHTQGGFHYRTRIPRFGRAIAYHFPSCDALISASGPEIYRLNLEQGRFLNPIVLEGDSGEDIAGVNVIDVNPAHQLLSFGVEGNGSVEMWDPRSRSRVGILRLPKSQLLPNTITTPLLPGIEGPGSNRALSVTALCSRLDGLSYAVGTSSGHTLLYDIRSPRPYALKDQGYGLPVKNVTWIDGGSRMAGDGMVLSADKKVIKIWDRNSSSANFASVTPASDINHVHHITGSGLVMLANEGIQMTTLYIPQLGPAPKWCSFLENITEEMEDQTARSVYEDYKFIERAELASLGLDHLVGTPALKPYMHGYFLSLKLYDTARVIANPFAYAEHREKLVRDKMDKLSESRIRARKDAQAPKVNKALAAKVLKDVERERKKEERRKEKTAEGMDLTGEVNGEADRAEKPNLLNDPRFKALFEDPAFEVDQQSREFGLLNPSTVAQSNKGTMKTAVEDEEDESDKASSDGMNEDDSEGGSMGGSSDDSSDAGDLEQYDPRARLPSGGRRTNERAEEAHARLRIRNGTGPRLVAMRPQINNVRGPTDREASFGQQLRRKTSLPNPSADDISVNGEGVLEMSWVPASSSRGDGPDGLDADDMLIPGGRGKRKDTGKRKGVHSFGAGLETGEDNSVVVSKSDRKGRTQRRHGIRSGSKNVFRRL